jgi:hypothetical protein
LLLLGDAKAKWIPAFAGMTGVGRHAEANAGLGDIPVRAMRQRHAVLRLE